MRIPPKLLSFQTLPRLALLNLVLLALLSPQSLLAGAPPPGADVAGETDPRDLWHQAEAAYEAGQAEKALRIVDRALAELPDDLRLNRWQIDFAGTPIDNVQIGRSSVYLVSQSSKVPKHLFADDPRPPITDRPTGFDFEMKISRFEASTGKLRWTRRTAGAFEVVIDPSTDDLYLFRHVELRRPKQFIRLAAKDGAVLTVVTLEPVLRPLGALALDDQLIVLRPYDWLKTRPEEEALVADPVGGRIDRRPAEALVLVAPEGEQVLSMQPARMQDGVEGVEFSLWSRTGGRRFSFWKRTIPGQGLHPPLWLDDGLVVATGAENNRARVTRLDLATGDIRWEFVLPRGIYRPGNEQLASNARAPAGWRPFQRIGDRLLVVGGEGTLYFLRLADGELLSRQSPFDAYLTAPAVVDDLLVVSSFDAVRAIPQARTLGDKSVDEASFLLLRARCLAALGQLEEALDLSRQLTESAPLLSDAWRLRADLVQRTGPESHEAEEIAALSRHLALTETLTSPELRARYGLERRIPTGTDLLADPVLVGETVFVGTTGGESFQIDTRTLEITGRRQHPVALHTLEVEVSGGGYDIARVLSVFGLSYPSPPDAPPEFLVNSGYDGFVVEYRGRYFRPLRGGRVRILDRGRVEELEPGVEGIESWAIHIGPAGPLGYGTGGVYRLDADLRPVERLVALGRDRRSQQDRQALLFSATESTLAVAFRRGRQYVLQIRSLDGSHLLREEEIAPLGDVRGRPHRLRPLANGYLLSADEIVWVDPRPERSVWRFAFPSEPGRAQPRQRPAHTTRFSPPLVSNGRVFVTCRDGGVYVFRVDEITAQAE